MKKLNIILTLLVSSFFLFSTNVKADTTIQIIEEEMSYMTNEDFLLLREKTIEYCEENDMYYYIYFKDSIFYSHIFDKTRLSSYDFSTTGTQIAIPNLISGHVSYINNGVLNVPVTYTKQRPELHATYNYSYALYLDSNIENALYTRTDVLTINYNEFSYSISNGMEMPTLYDIYLNSQVNEDPKAEIISNFYTVVIQKIGLFADLVTNDYIVFSSAVIFIFVALLGLVRRLM